jgi:hypothetical protein
MEASVDVSNFQNVEINYTSVAGDSSDERGSRGGFGMEEM